MPIRPRAARTIEQPNAPANGHKAKRVVYPYTDGKPLAESPEHLDELIRCFLLLQGRYADEPRVYVGADMFLYYEQGNPRAQVAPDVFVAKGVSKTRRRTSFRLWVERVPPSFVLELTSPSTAAEDLRKQEVYARLGVPEYVLYDPRPEARELGLPGAELLRGYRLGPAGYEPVEATPEGGLVSRELGLRLVDEGGRLAWYDLAWGARLLDPQERASVAEGRAAVAEGRAAVAEGRIAAEAEARRQAEQWAAAEAEARRAAEARLAELEEQLRRLRPPAP